MDIYAKTLSLLEEQPLLQEWAEMKYLLRRSVARQPRDWSLPVIACDAVCERPHEALPAVAALACVQMSIFLIDDLLDEDPRGVHHELGEAAAANMAAAFQAVGADVVAQSEAEASIRVAVLDSLHQMTFTTALGQYWDSQNPADEEGYWRMVSAKSGVFYGTALHIGALMGGAEAKLADEIKQIGHLYGEMGQIHDDLNDSLAVPANPDWLQGRLPLPILFATIVTHPERERFLALRQAIPHDPTALNEAQDILLRCGAISYGIDQLLRRHQQATQKLSAIPLAKRTGLEELLAEQVRPVWSLFKSIGVEEPEQMAFIPDTQAAA